MHEEKCPWILKLPGKLADVLFVSCVDSLVSNLQCVEHLVFSLFRDVGLPSSLGVLF